MISKEEYLNQKQHAQLDMNLAWEMYQEKCQKGKCIDFQTFQKVFPMWASNLIFSKPDKYYEYYDDKFKVNS